MVNGLYSKVIEIPPKVYSNEIVLLQPITTEENGVLTSKNEFRPYDFSEGSIEMKSSLFDIGNLMSVGAFDKLKTTFMSSISDFGIVDRFENLHYVQTDK